MDINVSEKTSASRPSPFKEENNNNALIWKWIILVGILLFVIFVVYPWATEQLDGSNKAKVTKNEVTQQETEIISKSNQVETAIDLAAENEMLIMDADNGLRFDMTSDQIEKHIIAQVRSGKMPNNNTITFMLKNGKVLHGHFKPYYTFGLLYSYELEFYMTPDGKDVTKNTYYDVVKTIDANHVGYMCYKSRSTVWIKDNMVIECGYRNLGSGTITLTYSNQPIAYNQRHGHDDYVKALCKTLLPQRDKHVHNMEKKYGGVVMEVLEYMRNRGSYKPVEWGPVVKKNNAYYVRHMYYSWNILHEKVLNNCMFRMDLDGEVTDIYAIDGTKYVYK